MDLHAHIASPRHFQEAQRPIGVAEHDVRRVLDHHDFVLHRKVDDTGIKLASRHLACRAVGIVDHQQLRAAADIGRYRVEIRQKIVRGQQRQAMDFAAVVLGVRARDRIAGHGHERHVARIDERRGQHGQGGLRADAVVDLLLRIEFDLELALHEAGGGLLEGGNAVVGITAVLRLVDLGGHHAADGRGGHLVVFADAEIDQPPLGMLGQRLALRPFDLLELVDLVAFAVIHAADAIGEHFLEVRVMTW